MSYEPKGIFATLPRTTRGAAIVLSGDPKGKNFLYSNGNSIVIRDIENPSVCDIYTEHSVQTTAARYSPSGFYICSGDVSGKVRIWDTTQKEHILKSEFQPLGGAIKDLAWSPDNQRIVVGGEGRDRFGHVFNADTGTSVGDIMGQSKALNAVDFRPSRPFRIASASEDNSIAFFHGPPFKFQFTINDHSRFVNALRYSPNGEVFVSGGAEGKAFIYDGKSGEKIGQLGELSPAHKGGIYGVSFSPDSKQVLTVSADKTAKIWDVPSGSLVQEFVMGTTVDDMQVGCLWLGENLITVSLSGVINYLDRGCPETPRRILKGHSKPITALAVNEDKGTVFTASSDGNVCHWNADTAENDLVRGKGHSNQVQDMMVVDGVLITCGMDDSIVYTDVATKQYGERVKMPSQPRGLATAPGGLVVAACINHVVVVRNQRVVFTQKVDYEPQCASITTDLSEVAIGGGMDQKVYIYRLTGDELSEKRTMDHNGGITDVKYSPDGAFLVATDTYRKVVLYQLPEYNILTSTEWGHHTAKINSVAWTPDSKHLATGSLDTSIIIWSVEKRSKTIIIKGAHPMSQVTRVAWLDDNTLISVGQDSCVRKWGIKHH
ncbi:Actin-interacting protein 1 [Lamellibrachia satsuma]|nr:Actin-interacting protein 1 [Lamellibrachia satsuma]